ncbi:hypothetical protein HPB47_024968 [Ixodes persulcatus]|uniref:Uncharacterized protein n=1 Tax=Ixodes persulcatus TaxID=34615 RepID=A0AC60Q4R4_IXOPE|nr:hypothetical protein HPB47_024968 [Ixodes persulcatus]
MSASKSVTMADLIMDDTEQAGPDQLTTTGLNRLNLYSTRTNLRNPVSRRQDQFILVDAVIQIAEGICWRGAQSTLSLGQVVASIGLLWGDE